MKGSGIFPLWFIVGTKAALCRCGTSVAGRLLGTFREMGVPIAQAK